MGVQTQLFSPNPHFTVVQTPSLAGKVFIVTSGTSGVGFELAKKILSSIGGNIHIAGRSGTRGPEAMAKVIAEIAATAYQTVGFTTGQLHSLTIDLDDLPTISPSVSDFLAKEARLDFLFNNTGLNRQLPKKCHHSRPRDAYRQQLPRTLPSDEATGSSPYSNLQSVPKDSVRVVSTSSGIVDTAGPRGGVSLAELESGKHYNDMNRRYSGSKASNWFLASGFGRRHTKDGIVAVVQNPETLRTPGWNGNP